MSYIQRLNNNIRKQILKMVDFNQLDLLKERYPEAPLGEIYKVVYQNVNICQNDYPPFDVYNLIRDNPNYDGFVIISNDGSKLQAIIIFYFKGNNLFIERVCARKNKFGWGSKLLKKVEDYARNAEVDFIKLHSGNNAWWIKKGYEVFEDNTDISKTYSEAQKRISKKGIGEYIKYKLTGGKKRKPKKKVIKRKSIKKKKVVKRKPIRKTKKVIRKIKK
jgi:hypothetical protein